MSEQPYATPAPPPQFPCPLPTLAATMPATCVPCFAESQPPVGSSSCQDAAGSGRSSCA